MRVCIEKSTGRLIESQSHAREGTLLQNALNTGYNEADIEEKEVTQEELEEEARAISIRQQMPIEVVRDFFGEDLGPLKDDLLVRKAIDSINANA